MDAFELVIVGGGLSSARAIKSYREAGGPGRILLLSRDASLPYHRPPLSKRYLRGEAEAADTLVEPEPFYADNDVEVLLEVDVTRVDPGETRVELADGPAFGFGKLLLAPGAVPRRLEVPGGDLDGVFTLRSLADSTRIREAAEHGWDAVVVGAGFIGLEVAASLRALERGVTLVHRQSGLFQHLRAGELEQGLGSLFAENGVQLVLPDEVASFRGKRRFDAVTTTAGRTLPGEFAVVGIGVEPAVGFLERSRLAVDNGIVVDGRFRASAPNVYAVGDVANFDDPLYGRRRIEHWSNANYQGTEVGKVLAGTGGGYDTVSTFFTEMFGVTINVFGDLGEHDEHAFRGSLNDRDLLGLYIRDGELRATVTIGQDEATETGSRSCCVRGLVRRPGPHSPTRRSTTSSRRTTGRVRRLMGRGSRPTVRWKNERRRKKKERLRRKSSPPPARGR